MDVQSSGPFFFLLSTFLFGFANAKSSVVGMGMQVGFWSYDLPRILLGSTSEAAFVCDVHVKFVKGNNFMKMALIIKG